MKRTPLRFRSAKSVDAQGISPDDHKPQLTEEEIDHHRLDARDKPFQVGDVVLPRFGVEQVRPGDVRVALLQSDQPLRATRIRREDEEFGMGLPEAGLEDVENGIVAPRGQKRPRDPAALLPRHLQSRFRIRLDPGIDHLFRKDPLPRNPRRRHPPRLDQGVDLLLVDVQVSGNLFGVHHLFRHDPPPYKRRMIIQ